MGITDSDCLADFSDLVKFCRARCDEDEHAGQVMLDAGERMAERATPKDYADAAGVAMTALSDPELGDFLLDWCDELNEPRMLPNDVRRIAKEVTAKRAVLDAYEASVRMVGPGLSRGLLRPVAAQAETWDDHPRYKEAWRP
jgi:hypothetical protein